MAAQSTNALLFLVSTLFDLALGALLLRVLLQWTRADFYNPLSQFIWKITNPVTQPLRPLLPRSRNIDLASLVLMYVVALIDLAVIAGLFAPGVSVFALAFYALLKCVVLAIKLYTLSLFTQAILSWVGPGVNNPAANVLYSLNEPLLRPVRRFIPPVGALDLSPLVVMLALQVLVRLIPLPALFA